VKAPKPTIPRCLPEGSVCYGGPIEWFVLRLTINSKDLVPDEVTGLVGCDPDDAWEAGKPLLGEDGSIKRIPKFGHWSVELRPEDTDEWDCGEAIMELIHRLPSDIGLWRQLTQRYKVDVTFALLMTSTNEGFVLSPQVLKYLGDRGLTAGFDVYYEEPAAAEPSAAPNRRPARRRAVRTPRKGGGR
jgi:hypothetical protein